MSKSLRIRNTSSKIKAISPSVVQILWTVKLRPPPYPENMQCSNLGRTSGGSTKSHLLQNHKLSISLEAENHELRIPPNEHHQVSLGDLFRLGNSCYDFTLIGTCPTSDTIDSTPCSNPECICEITTIVFCNVKGRKLFCGICLESR